MDKMFISVVNICMVGQLVFGNTWHLLVCTSECDNKFHFVERGRGVVTSYA